MHLTRRTLIRNIFATSVALPVAGPLSVFSSNGKPLSSLKNNINHSVCRWTFNSFTVEELCLAVKKIGFNAIDLVGPKDWPTLKEHGIFSSMCYTSGENSLTKGWNDTSNHDTLVKDFNEVIPLMVKEGYKNVICFSGSRNGMDDETGFKNCVKGLQKIMPLAEKNGITVQMELLNSKVDHKDYMCDKTPWGVELCKRLGSESFKLLYDIYHMQIDEGDVIRTIKDNHKFIGHYHTGGVPGRHEINESQELYYPAIMKAILETGFKDYVAQEFIPAKENKTASLEEAIKICDV